MRKTVKEDQLFIFLQVLLYLDVTQKIEYEKNMSPQTA